MTDQPEIDSETVEALPDPDEDTEELEPLDIVDESVYLVEDEDLYLDDDLGDEDQVELDTVHPWVTEEEENEGQRLGEEIDTEDDEDTGIEEADELDPNEEANPYSDEGEVVQDADVSA